MTTVLFRITGERGAESAVPWISHRAKILDLKGWVARKTPSQIDVLLAGPEPLIEAMEVACSLGPGDVLVEQIEWLSPPTQAVPTEFKIMPPT